MKKSNGTKSGRVGGEKMKQATRKYASSEVEMQKMILYFHANDFLFYAE